MDFPKKQMEFKHFGGEISSQKHTFEIYYVFDKPFYRQWGKVFYPH